jgi:hypothetical protein
MANSAEIEIELNGETLECVSECTYLGHSGITREKISKIEFQWTGKCLSASRLYWPRNLKKKIEIKKGILE